MPSNTYKTFLSDPDMALRRAELAAFAGPHAEKFLKTYDTQAAITQRPPGEKIKLQFFKGSFIWPVFFVGPVWFFYRKMWAWGAGIAVFVILIGSIPVTARLSLPFAVATASAASLLYLGHAVKTIERLRAASPGGVVDHAALAAAGGVSRRAGWIAGLIYGALTAIGLYSNLSEILAGSVPQ